MVFTFLMYVCSEMKLIVISQKSPQIPPNCVFGGICVIISLWEKTPFQSFDLAVFRPHDEISLSLFWMYSVRNESSLFSTLLTICVLLTASFDWRFSFANVCHCVCPCGAGGQSLSGEAGLRARGRQQRGDSSAAHCGEQPTCQLVFGVVVRYWEATAVIMTDYNGENGRITDWDYTVLQRRFGRDVKMPQRFNPNCWYHHFLDITQWS